MRVSYDEVLDQMEGLIVATGRINKIHDLMRIPFLNRHERMGWSERLFIMKK